MRYCHNNSNCSSNKCSCNRNYRNCNGEAASRALGCEFVSPVGGESHCRRQLAAALDSGELGLPVACCWLRMAEALQRSARMATGARLRLLQACRAAWRRLLHTHEAYRESCCVTFCARARASKLVEGNLRTTQSRSRAQPEVKAKQPQDDNKAKLFANCRFELCSRLLQRCLPREARLAQPKEAAKKAAFRLAELQTQAQLQASINSRNVTKAASAQRSAFRTSLFAICNFCDLCKRQKCCLL